MRTILLILLLWPALAIADYKSDYKSAVAAAERQEWSTADALLRRAMTEKPEPDGKEQIRFYGQRFEPYLPQFYLGYSAFSRNDCQAATELLSDPRLVAATRGRREEDRRLMMLRTCKVRLAGTATVPATTTNPAPTTPVVAATTASTSAANPVRPAPPKVAPAPASAVAFDSRRVVALEARVSQTNGKLAAARLNLEDPGLATARATLQRQAATLEADLKRLGVRARSIRQASDQAAISGLERDMQALDSRVDQYAGDLTEAISRGRGVALADARSQLQRGVDAGTRALASVSDSNAPSAQALRQALDQGRGLLASSDTAKIQASSAALEAALRQSETSQARQALAGQVRSRLRPLAAAYLEGDFAQVARWNGASELTSVPAAHAQALLMRSAARFELYVLNGEHDSAQFEQVRADIRAARRVLAQVLPSEKAYSPRFRALFASTR